VVGKDIYLVGICGTGVGALAGLLKRQGHRVRGSDEKAYPPMSDKLREWGIPVHEGYDAAHLSPRPDLVIIGNVIRKTNPEATYARDNGLAVMSMPQAVAEFGIGSKHSIVVAGTHGKTTTTALAAHVLIERGRDPGFLVGGALVGYSDSFRAGSGGEFVVEGDEYDTAYFDKGPKFLHYRPRTAIITSIEFDHADIYKDADHVESAFARLVDIVPEDGHLVAWHGAERARKLAEARARARRVTLYARERAPGVDLWLDECRMGPAGLTLKPVLRGESLGEMVVPLWGEINALNALAVVAALHGVGLSPRDIAAGLATFRGVKRRLEVRGEPRGVTVVDDFAHHPTAVRETLAAARTRWPGRRMWAIFEPRSATSRRNVFTEEYVEAFSRADRVVIGSHARLHEIAESERFDPAALAERVADRGVPASALAEVDAIATLVAREAEQGDVVMVMSNGDFGGLHAKILAGLA
jgi:UDP-N-acetylmuramate: L-alanyl-gamma-D-glutamyl-meso-diaminopimelate ligase